MPKQYGSNGINSDGSLMNVGNVIWDPNNGGRPSIKLHSDKNAMAKTTPPWLLDEIPSTNNNIKNRNNINKNDKNTK
tara:strand:+ start:179 stop:409 length:231 start_codon:yes stop_codon:yes gene_type:complete